VLIVAKLHIELWTDLKLREILTLRYVCFKLVKTIQNF